MNDFVNEYLNEAIEVINAIDQNEILNMIQVLVNVRNDGGRIFVCGLGGSAGNANHLVNDLRKITNIQAYSPTDNVSELTARINDEGFESFFEKYFEISNLNNKDGIIVLSVGGGSVNPPVSITLVNAIKYALKVDAKVLGIVGKDGGQSKLLSKDVIVIPNKFSHHVTQHTESITAIIWHLIVSHPYLKINNTKW